MVMTTTSTAQRVLEKLRFKLERVTHYFPSCISSPPISTSPPLHRRHFTRRITQSAFEHFLRQWRHLNRTATRQSIVFKTLNERLSLSRPNLSGLEQLNLKKKENRDHLKAKCRLRLRQRNQAKGNATMLVFSLHILLICLNLQQMHSEFLVIAIIVIKLQ